MQHQQRQIHEDLILQMVLPCIVASYVHHKYEVVFGMDLLQSEYFQYKSANTIFSLVNFTVCHLITLKGRNPYVYFIQFISSL